MKFKQSDASLFEYNAKDQRVYVGANNGQLLQGWH